MVEGKGNGREWPTDVAVGLCIYMGVALPL